VRRVRPEIEEVAQHNELSDRVAPRRVRDHVVEDGGEVRLVQRPLVPARLRPGPDVDVAEDDRPAALTAPWPVSALRGERRRVPTPRRIRVAGAGAGVEPRRAVASGRRRDVLRRRAVLPAGRVGVLGLHGQCRLTVSPPSPPTGAAPPADGVVPGSGCQPGTWSIGAMSSLVMPPSVPVRPVLSPASGSVWISVGSGPLLSGGGEDASIGSFPPPSFGFTGCFSRLNRVSSSPGLGICGVVPPT